MSHGVICINTKFRSNVGMILRLSAAFGADYFYWTGNRAELAPNEISGRTRLPREERMKDYKNVDFRNLSEHSLGVALSVLQPHTPIAVEYRQDFEPLTTFKHPENAIYIFGSEDEGIPASVLRRCHRFTTVPSDHVLNLATAVAIVLYDRRQKENA